LTEKINLLLSFNSMTQRDVLYKKFLYEKIVKFLIAYNQKSLKDSVVVLVETFVFDRVLC
jgi:hypothetical protein